MFPGNWNSIPSTNILTRSRHGFQYWSRKLHISVCHWINECPKRQHYINSMLSLVSPLVSDLRLVLIYESSDYIFALFAPATLLTTTLIPSTFAGHCTSPLSSGAVIVYSQYKSTFASTTQTDTSALPASFVSTTITKPTVIVAVAFSGTNIAAVQTTSSSSTSSQISSVGTIPSETAAPASSATGNTTHRLSQNSLVGITIGAAFGLFSLLMLVSWLSIRRRRAPEGKLDSRNGERQELPGREGRIEMDGSGKRFELVSSRHVAHEMAVQEKMVELAG